ncbi:MAG: VOC family protein [Dehalococcoidia bacterium]|nr:VOC family protein [Dehalococcoidia bacterium]
MSLSTYINFDGNCREAFEFYRSVFGGEFDVMETFRNGPGDMGMPEDELDNVMHVSFPIGSSVLMGSDMPSTFGPPVKQGNNFSISYSATSREESDDLFGKLAKGGTVSMPMQDMFWGSYFGSCTDKFGINWQINFELSEE